MLSSVSMIEYSGVFLFCVCVCALVFIVPLFLVRLLHVQLCQKKSWILNLYASFGLSEFTMQWSEHFQGTRMSSWKHRSSCLFDPWPGLWQKYWSKEDKMIYHWKQAGKITWGGFLHDPFHKTGLVYKQFDVTKSVKDTSLMTSLLTHWGWDNMAAILQTTHSTAFSWINMLKFQLKFHYSLFLRFQLTIFQHWFR